MNKKNAARRELAAIMFTDIVGYSSLTQRNEALALKLLEVQRRILGKILPKYGGKQIKTIGDGCLIEFGSALAASQCAVEIQRSIKKQFRSSPDGEKLRVRIGIHVGDVVRQNSDIVGDAVNIASRIESISPPEGICISQQVFDQVENKLGESIQRIGVRQLKNIRQSICIYQILVDGSKAIDAADVESAPNFEPKKMDGHRIAVLPFANNSPDGKDEYFADGLTDEIISTLSRIPDFRVIARTSVLRFKGERSKSLGDISRELGVKSILEGSVMKIRDSARITVQLVDPENEESLWSQEYDRKVEDIFAIQTDIAQRVSKSLKVAVFPGKIKEGIEKRSTADVEAYTLYLKGRYFWNKRTESDLLKAAEFFNEAKKRDPSYAPAYAGLSDTYSVLALLEFMPPRKAFPKAEKAAKQALELEDSLGEAHTSLGLVKFQYEWDWEGAEQEFKRAIKLNPSYGSAHHFYADLLKAQGRFDEALYQIKLAHEIDPLSLAINTGVGHVLYLSRKYDEAIEQYRKTVELDPKFLQARLWFGRPYMQKGLFKDAIRELKQAVKLSNNGTIALSMLGQAYASAGMKKEANQILNLLKERSKSKYVPSYWLAVIYNALEDSDEAFQWFEKAYKERSSWLAWIKVEPRFDRLRSDKRFASLLHRMNLD